MDEKVHPFCSMQYCLKCGKKQTANPIYGRPHIYDKIRNVLEVVCNGCGYKWYEQCSDGSEPIGLVAPPVKFEPKIKYNDHLEIGMFSEIKEFMQNIIEPVDQDILKENITNIYKDLEPKENNDQTEEKK